MYVGCLWGNVYDVYMVIKVRRHVSKPHDISSISVTGSIRFNDASDTEHKSSALETTVIRKLIVEMS